MFYISFYTVFIQYYLQVKEKKLYYTNLWSLSSLLKTFPEAHCFINSHQLKIEPCSWAHLLYKIFSKMLLIFSDYAAEIQNVPGATNPALIDLCVRQAKFRCTFITAEVFPFFWLKCMGEFKCHSSSHSFAGSLHIEILHLSQVHGSRRRDASCVYCFIPHTLPSHQFSFLFLVTEPETVILTAFSILWTDLSHISTLFCGWLFQSASSVSTLVTSSAKKNISDGWEHSYGIFFSFFIKGK